MNSSESRLANHRFLGWADRHLVGVLAGLGILSFGIWNTGVPFGDEGVHIQEAIGLYESGEYSSNTYFAFYVLIFRWITEDPVNAHLLFRFLSALFSTLGLYYVLRGFPNLNRLAITLASLWWATTHLCTPYIQSGNSNLFALALVLPGLGLLVRKVSLPRLIVFVTLCLLASHVRSEYLAPLILITSYGLYLLVRKKKQEKQTGTSWLSKSTVMACLALLATGVYLQTAKNMAADRSSDQYLLQGLGQCWGNYYRKKHPEQVFDPYTEYQPVLNRVFGNPTGFFDAITNNPREAFTYFLINGASNMTQVVPGMLETPSRLKFYLLFAILAGCLIVKLLKSWPQLKGSGRWHFLYEELGWSQPVNFLVLLTTASSVAIILLIPDRRYWISCAPLVYYGVALIFTWSLASLQDSPWRRPALAGLILLICFPLLWLKPGNQRLINAMRQAGQHYLPQPVVAGNFALPYVTFAFQGKAKAINLSHGISWDNLSNQKYDIFIADGLSATTFWQQQKDELDSFIQNPDQYGFWQLSLEKSNGSLVFFRHVSNH